MPVGLTFTLRASGLGRMGGRFVLESADPIRLMAASTTSSESADLTESKEAALISPLELPFIKLADSAKSLRTTNSGTPCPGALPDLIVMVILSGPLDSDPALMNIFWWGGVMARGEVTDGELGWESWEGFAGGILCSDCCAGFLSVALPDLGL